MITSLLNQGNRTQVNPLNNLQEIASVLRSSTNPMAIIQSDPRMQEISKIIKENGGSIQNAVYSLAKAKGIDPSTVLQQAQSMAQSFK